MPKTYVYDPNIPLLIGDSVELRISSSGKAKYLVVDSRKDGVVVWGEYHKTSVTYENIRRGAVIVCGHVVKDLDFLCYLFHKRLIVFKFGSSPYRNNDIKSCINLLRERPLFGMEEEKQMRKLSDGNYYSSLFVYKMARGNVGITDNLDRTTAGSWNSINVDSSWFECGHPKFDVGL